VASIGQAATGLTLNAFGAGPGDPIQTGVEQDVIEAHLRRIEAVNPSINAVTVVLGEEALHGAKQADEAVARGGDAPIADAGLWRVPARAPARHRPLSTHIPFRSAMTAVRVAITISADRPLRLTPRDQTPG
jgi:predicted kinase